MATKTAPPDSLQALAERFEPDVIEVPGGRARIRLEVRGEGAWDARIEKGRVRLAKAGSAGDAVGDAAGLLGALDLDREAGDHLPPTVADLVELDDLGAGADARARRHRGLEADLVPAGVDAEDEAARLDQLQAEAVDHRQRQVAVGDGAAERTLVLCPLDVDVDPLVVAGEVGEGVDVVLGDLAPLARPDLLADQLLDALDALYLGDRHARRSLHSQATNRTSSGGVSRAPEPSSSARMRAT